MAFSLNENGRLTAPKLGIKNCAFEHRLGCEDRLSALQAGWRF